MKALWLFLALAGWAVSAPLEVRLPDGWTTWAARAEIAPRTFVDKVHARGRAGSLAISGNSNAAVYGGWEYRTQQIEAGRWYRLTAYYRAEGLQDERLQVVARLDWTKAEGKRAGQPDYGYRVTLDGEWRRVTLEAPAPAGTAAVRIQLFLQNAPSATVWWDDVSLEVMDAPGPRRVTVAAVNLRPQRTAGPAENDYPTHIIDPEGELLAAAPERGSAAIATLDLNRRYADQWLGDMRGRFFKELRLDVTTAPVLSH